MRNAMIKHATMKVGEDMKKQDPEYKIRADIVDKMRAEAEDKERHAIQQTWDQSLCRKHKIE